MHARDLLANQLRLVHDRVAGLEGLTRDEWLSRPAPGDNRVGFTAWHIVAVRDWTVRAILMAERPLGWDAPFTGTGVALCPIPFGMPAAEADTIAEAVTPGEVAAYSAVVQAELERWLAAADDAALDLPPPRGRDHLALSARYSDEPYVRELFESPADMTAWPVWEWLTKPPLTHCLGHLTEIDMTRRALE